MGVAHGPLRKRYSGKGRAVPERLPVDRSSWSGTKRPTRDCRRCAVAEIGGTGGNGPNLLLCSFAASRSARCSKDAAPLSRLVGSQDRIVARVRRGGHIRPGLAFFRPRCHPCHYCGQRCGRCRGNHQIVPLFRTRAAVGSASVLHEAGKWCAFAPFPITGYRAIQKVGRPTFLT
jgi:hypothetical protein